MAIRKSITGKINTKEWAKHLRKDGKRNANKKERRNGKVKI